MNIGDADHSQEMPSKPNDNMKGIERNSQSDDQVFFYLKYWRQPLHCALSHQNLIISEAEVSTFGTVDKNGKKFFYLLQNTWCTSYFLNNLDYKMHCLIFSNK